MHGGGIPLYIQEFKAGKANNKQAKIVFPP